MVEGVFDELAREQPRRRFTIGIDDDVSGTSLPDDPDLTSSRRGRSARFSSASARTARSAPTRTRSRSRRRRRGSRSGLLRLRLEEVGLPDGVAPSLRPAPDPVPYLVSRASFVGCHQLKLLDRPEVLDRAGPGATLLLNCPYDPGDVWESSPPGPGADRRQGNQLYAIDAGRIAREAGLRAAPTRSSRRASSRPPGCCHARKRSLASRRRSRRPTAGEATRSSGATTPPSTALSTGCTRSTFLGSPAAGTRSPCSSRTMHPSSFAR